MRAILRYRKPFFRPIVLFIMMKYKGRINYEARLYNSLILFIPKTQPIGLLFTKIYCVTLWMLTISVYWWLNLYVFEFYFRRSSFCRQNTLFRKFPDKENLSQEWLIINVLIEIWSWKFDWNLKRRIKCINRYEGWKDSSYWEILNWINRKSCKRSNRSVSTEYLFPNSKSSCYNF